MARRATEMMYGYTVNEVARFLQYDESAVRYWLRTGHLRGCVDPTLADWRVTANDLVTFLRQSSEPMPTGAIAEPIDVVEELVSAPEPPRRVAVKVKPEPILVDADLVATGSVAG